MVIINWSLPGAVWGNIWHWKPTLSCPLPYPDCPSGNIILGQHHFRIIQNSLKCSKWTCGLHQQFVFWLWYKSQNVTIYEWLLLTTAVQQNIWIGRFNGRKCCLYECVYELNGNKLHNIYSTGYPKKFRFCPVLSF